MAAKLLISILTRSAQRSINVIEAANDIIGDFVAAPYSLLWRQSFGEGLEEFLRIEPSPVRERLSEYQKSISVELSNREAESERTRWERARLLLEVILKESYPNIDLSLLTSADFFDDLLGFASLFLVNRIEFSLFGESQHRC